MGWVVKKLTRCKLRITSTQHRERDMSKAYSSNLTPDQFELLLDLIPAPKPGGRPREVDMWEIRERHFLHPLRGLSLAGFA